VAKGLARALRRERGHPRGRGTRPFASAQLVSGPQVLWVDEERLLPEVRLVGLDLVLVAPCSGAPCRAIPTRTRRSSSERAARP